MQFCNYIGGQWRPASSGKTFLNINPADTSDIIGEFPQSTDSDVRMAAEAAREAYKTWRLVPAPKRGELLRKAGQILEARKDELAREMTREMGKIFTEAKGDVQEAIDTAYYAASEGRRLFGYTVPSELPNKFAMSIRQPIGVAGCITPWNFPLAIPSWKIFPALLCGNTVVFKPAMDTPKTAHTFVEILIEAGIPEGVINLVHGGDDAGKAVVADPNIQLISFTGSSETGKIVAQHCAAQHKRVSLEMGGKNAVILMDDADLQLALDGVIWGAFGTTGQRCTATSRLLLHEKIHDKFIEMLVRRVERLRVGNGNDAGVDMGPVINAEQMQRILDYIELGKQEGATCIIGGTRLTENGLAKGFFIAPTIFINVKPEHRIAQEEIFGPVLSVLKFKTFEEAVKILNSVRYGLSSSLYTHNINLAFQAIRDFEAGITYINAPTIGAEAHLPFGGVKETGNGHREGGWQVYDFFSETKTVYVDFSGVLQRAQIDNYN
ncbi:MAG: aldehyde dehydrogenase family protein [Candidatus Thermochlorobacter aerophilum]|jgi:aldehyde dehydrogenase (NAD+)|uniref:aldehyde dehydrogenase (NAD(+)) n=1 Tax=Candidatus Thermochlorobacter aerophilus TaxID=1868324 RepID=A0A395LXJ0_9BACT|nr:MAG: aldehyde dehydrogenase family protein [Candidatus Thermochlorobacter aerophilum]